MREALGPAADEIAVPGGDGLVIGGAFEGLGCGAQAIGGLR